MARWYCLVGWMSVCGFGGACVDAPLPDAWRSEISRWVEEYQRRGFPFARVEWQMDSCGNHIRIWLLRGEGWVWGRPRSRMPLRTRPEVLERLSLLRRGTAVSLPDLERSKRALARRGYFAVGDSVALFRAENRNRLIPVFDLTELTQNKAEMLIWLSNDAGSGQMWEGRLALDLMNLRGSGRDLRLGALRSRREQEMTAEWLEPALWNTLWDARLSAQMFDDSGHTQALLRGALEAQMDFSWRLAVSAEVAGADSGNWWRAGAIRVLYDDRDRIPLTREGGYLESAWRGVVARGGERRYAMAEFCAGVARRLSSRLSWEPIVRAGALMPWDLAYGRRELFTLSGEWLPGYWPRSVVATRYVSGTLSIKYFWDHATMGGLFANFAWVHGDSAVPDVEEFPADYGVSLEQSRRGTGVVLRCGWKRGAAWRDGLLSVGLRTRF